MNGKVFIYSIERPTATGIEQFVNDNSGKRMRKTKIGRAKTRIQANYSGQVGGLKNGLSNKPWIENGIQKTDSTGNRMTLQDKEEQRWNLPKGYLTNRPLQASETKLPDDKRTYYQTKSWVLNDGCTVLDLSDFDQAMFYYVVLDSKYVANSEAEWRAHKWPYAQWYIAQESEEEEIKYSKNSRKLKAFAALEAPDLTDELKRKFCAILGIADARISLTKETIENMLYNWVDKTTFLPGSNIEKLEELVQLLKTAPGREEVEARYVLQRALSCRIVYEKQGTYTYVKATGSITLGETYSEAVQFLTNPKKSAVVEDLLKEISTKIIE